MKKVFNSFYVLPIAMTVLMFGGVFGGMYYAETTKIWYRCQIRYNDGEIENIEVRTGNIRMTTHLDYTCATRLDRCDIRAIDCKQIHRIK